MVKKREEGFGSGEIFFFCGIFLRLKLNICLQEISLLLKIIEVENARIVYESI